jgi:hypothetical protein
MPEQNSIFIQTYKTTFFEGGNVLKALHNAGASKTATKLPRIEEKSLLG